MAWIRMAVANVMRDGHILKVEQTGLKGDRMWADRKTEVKCDCKFLTQAIEKRKRPFKEIEMTVGETGWGWEKETRDSVKVE